MQSKADDMKTKEQKIKEKRRSAMMEMQLNHLHQKTEEMSTAIEGMAKSIAHLQEVYGKQLDAVRRQELPQPVTGSMLQLTEGQASRAEMRSIDSSTANRAEAAMNAAFAELFKPDVKYVVGFAAEMQSIDTAGEE